MAVIRLLENSGWNALFHRAKTNISEIDLILEKNNKIILIEVKRLDQDWRVFHRLHSKQKNKLLQNLLMLSLKFNEYEFEAYAAWVDPKNRISFCKIN